MTTVIGLGNERGDLTKRGEEAIFEAQKAGAKIAVRTAKTRSYQSVLDLGVEHVCFDFVYEKSRNFATLAKNLASAVLALGENTVYLVDGAPCEDTSVKALIKRTRGKIKMIDGVSKITSIAGQANFQGCSFSAVSAYELIENAGELSLPLIVYDMDDQALASDCKLVLGDLFGEETRARFLSGGKAKDIALFQLDRQTAYDYTSAVAIEKIDLLEKKRFALNDLKEILLRLRAPNGCPWDRVQTSESIKMAAIEEAYELVDAIDQKDDEKILEETGDLLMQVMFHTVLKEETGAFNLSDVISGVCDKLISRHTHVFGNDGATDENAALSVWDKNKMTEKHQETYADAVNDVPKCFPALMRAQKVGKRAGKAGMDFASVEAAAERMQAEIEEFFQATTQNEKEKELGDLLFAAVNVGRKAGCDAEKALKESIERFAARFTLAEKKALQDGKIVTELSEEEWDRYYLQAKEELKCN